jgi:hypothetical protein
VELHFRRPEAPTWIQEITVLQQLLSISVTNCKTGTPNPDLGDIRTGSQKEEARHFLKKMAGFCYFG